MSHESVPKRRYPAMDSYAMSDYCRSTEFQNLVASRATHTLLVRVMSLDAPRDSPQYIAVDAVITQRRAGFFIRECIDYYVSAVGTCLSYDCARAYNRCFDTCQIDKWNNTVHHTKAFDDLERFVGSIIRPFAEDWVEQGRPANHRMSRVRDVPSTNKTA